MLVSIPIGAPINNQITKKIDQQTKNVKEYGSIVAVNVPIPAFLSYFCANTMITAKYVISGVMRFVLESPIRYAN